MHEPTQPPAESAAEVAVGDAPASEADSAGDALVLEELLIGEITIDGMCGVY